MRSINLVSFSLIVSCCLTRCLSAVCGGRSAHPQGCTRVADVGGNKGIAVPKFKASVEDVQVIMHTVESLLKGFTLVDRASYGCASLVLRLSLPFVTIGGSIFLVPFYTAPSLRRCFFSCVHMLLFSAAFVLLPPPLAPYDL